MDPPRRRRRRELAGAAVGAQEQDLRLLQLRVAGDGLQHVLLHLVAAQQISGVKPSPTAAETLRKRDHSTALAIHPQHTAALEMHKTEINLEISLA